MVSMKCNQAFRGTDKQNLRYADTEVLTGRGWDRPHCESTSSCHCYVETKMQAEGRALIGSMFPKRANNSPSVINSGDYTTKLVRVAENDEKLSIFKGVPQSSMFITPNAHARML